MKAQRQSIRGSIAIEAAMIVPLVIIAVVIVIYIMLMIFQICIMQITANSIAERTAAVYYNRNADFDDGKTSKAEIASLDLYRRWVLNSAVEQGVLQTDALNALRKNSILKNNNASIDIMQSSNIISRKIIVVISSNYDNPMGGITAIWGLKSKIDLSVRAEAVVEDPAEFIRNSDFILETASKIPAINEFEGKWQEIVNKIIEYVNKFTKEHDPNNG